MMTTSFGSMNLRVLGAISLLYCELERCGFSDVPSVWQLNIPPRIYIFLWLLSKNKLLTGDNLAKRRKLDDQTCLFCSEPESIKHLFFDYCVVKLLWLEISNIVGKSIGQDFESIARWWVSNKKKKWKSELCLCRCSLGSMETKERFVLSGKMLAWSGTAAATGGKDAAQMEDSDQGGQAFGYGCLHRGIGATWSKDTEDRLGFRVGDVFVFSVPSGLQRCSSGGE
jgi:hypothetical protein